MQNWTERTELLLGPVALQTLRSSHVMVVGVGGVGGYAAEMIARSGVGQMTLIDADTVKESNINRQLIATQNNVGKSKVQLFQERLLSINPELQINALEIFVEESNLAEIMQQYRPNFVVDAIDSISPKVHLIRYCLENKIAIISSMGAGGRIDPTQLHFADISKTEYCSLARTIRTRLKKIGIYKGLPVVYSTEPVNKESVVKVDDERNKCSTLGTISYLPAIFGCYIASYCIRKLTGLLEK